MSDERDQSTAAFAVILAACLWASNYAAACFPELPGTLDLRPWVRVWNRPIIINWPVAAALFGLFFIIRHHLREAREKRARLRDADEPRDEEYPPFE